jgi:hypothetical protein
VHPSPYGMHNVLASFMKNPVAQVKDLVLARHVSTFQFPEIFFDLALPLHPPCHMNFAFPGAIDYA